LAIYPTYCKCLIINVSHLTTYLFQENLKIEHPVFTTTMTKLTGILYSLFLQQVVPEQQISLFSNVADILENECGKILKAISVGQTNPNAHISIASCISSFIDTQICKL
jgi:hypothetical protein